MRAARQSGPDGLAGMAALVEQSRGAPAAAAARACPGPGSPRRSLARGVPWIDDPSNADRALRAGAAAGRAALAPARRRGPAAPSDRPATARWPQAAVDDRWSSTRRATSPSTGRPLRAWARNLQARLLSRVVQAVGGRDHPPRRERLERAVRPALRGVRGVPARKVGQEPGFHAFRLQADAATGARTAAGCAGLSGPNMAGEWQKRGQPLDSGCFFCLRRVRALPI